MEHTIRMWDGIKKLSKEWNIHDPEAQGIVSPSTFLKILNATPRPYGFGARPHNRFEMLNFLFNPERSENGGASEDDDPTEYWIPIHCILQSGYKDEIEYVVRYDEMLVQLGKSIGQMNVNAINWQEMRKKKI